jgi:excisionase family DNA binding protein
MPRKKPRSRISPEERAYTTDEVAQHLNVSRRSVQQWIKAGKLAAMRFGREYRIEAKDLAHSIGLSGDAPILSPYA